MHKKHGGAAGESQAKDGIRRASDSPQEQYQEYFLELVVAGFIGQPEAAFPVRLRRPEPVGRERAFHDLKASSSAQLSSNAESEK